MVELRALMSAPDAPSAWDLRCEVREALVTYLQRQHPGSLPRTRVLLVESDGERRPAWAREPAAGSRRDRPE